MLKRACIVGNKHCSDGGIAVAGGSRCRAHRRSNWATHKPAHSEVYRSRRWTDLRKRVLREEPICAEPGCSAKSTSADHIVSLADGGEPFERSNLRGMCRACHKRRSSRQGAAARKRRREP